MLITALLCLNVTVASVAIDAPSYAAVTPLNAEQSVSAVADTPAKAIKASEKVDEEIEIAGERLQSILHGSLAKAFKAFREGNFAKAERKFGKLARRESFRGIGRDIGREAVSHLLDLPIGRGAIFSETAWDTETAPPSSAPNAKARSIDFIVTPAHAEAAASELYFITAVTQERQGKIERARKSYKKAIHLNKRNLDARLEYSLLLLRTGDLETAGAQLERLEKLLDSKCSGVRCGFSPESEVRYGLIEQAYSRLLVEATLRH